MTEHNQPYLIVGLGNPGREYRNTRHNIGFMLLDQLAARLGVKFTRVQSNALVTKGNHQTHRLILAKPRTYMNLSGQAVGALARFYKTPKEKILVAHDDVDLPVGRIKVARGSGSGGHKGVRSIIDLLGSTEFGRIKIGIGRPQCGEAIEDYVLAPFYEDERNIVEDVLRMATKACELFVSEGIEPAMNKINCQNLANKEES